jgi:hypothetical protein
MNEIKCDSAIRNNNRLELFAIVMICFGFIKIVLNKWTSIEDFGDFIRLLGEFNFLILGIGLLVYLARKTKKLKSYFIRVSSDKINYKLDENERDFHKDSIQKITIHIERILLIDFENNEFEINFRNLLGEEKLVKELFKNLKIDWQK